MTKNILVEGAYPARKPRESAPRTSLPPEPGIGVHRHTAAVTWALVGHLDRDSPPWFSADLRALQIPLTPNDRDAARGLTGRARCWLCRAHDRRGSLRSADFDRGRLPGIGADCRHTGKRHTQRHRHTRHRGIRIGGVSDDLCHPDGGHSSNCEHDDGWLGNRVRRGRPIRQWGLGWGLGQPIGTPGSTGDIVLSRCFRRVFGERCDGTIEQRSGVGAVPALRSLGNAALPSRDRSFLRALTEVGSGWRRSNL